MANSVECPGWIVLARAMRVCDRKGREHTITTIKIRARGYIPDVYVQLDRDVIDESLFDDEAFIASVMAVLQGVGYQGRHFDRAELGMQGRNYIVLEPGPAFRQFVVQRYGWHDLDRSPTTLTEKAANAALEGFHVHPRH